MENEIKKEEDVPPSSSKKFNCDISEWKDWEWQLKNRIKTIDKFKEVFPEIGISDLKLDEVATKYPFAITPYYASLIKEFNYSDPVFSMSIPNVSELIDSPYLSDDPLCESHDMAVPFLVHRYKDRCLLMSTSMCSMYCRYCTRKRLAGKKETHISSKRLAKIKEYLQKHNEIKDVIISGGDPFTQENSFIEEILETVRSVPHIEIIRFGTRVPVVLPQRITSKLIALLKRFKPLWINTHFNHSQEITPESIEACRKIIDAGIPMGNQTVLLKGINDDPVVIEELCRNLIKIPIKPYYLYQCDLVRGVDHFRTPVEKGIEIMEHLRGRLSGIAIPTFVIDAPGGKGKIPLLPNYYKGKENNIHHLVNYMGESVDYPDRY